VTRESVTRTQQQTSATLPPSNVILQRKCAACGQHTISGGKCEACHKKRSFSEHRTTNHAISSELPPIVQEVLRSSGQPLDTDTYSFIEQRFNHDFSQVRVHNDFKAAESAREVNASAYTVEHDVVFGSGRYTPGTTTGKRLLAHELTHVVQQDRSSHFSPKSFNEDNNTAIEQEADRAANMIVANQMARVSEITGLVGEGIGISRQIRVQLQRSRLDYDPIHQPIIERFRREQGLPEGGVDEFGHRVGPTDAEIIYGALWVINITGPSTVDHYCAAYVRSDATSCGIFPAPPITLTASGVPHGSSVQWSVTNGVNKVAIVGSATTPTVTIRGIIKSNTPNDVTIQAQVGAITATHQLSVLEPTTMDTGIRNPTNFPHLIAADVRYTVFDQFGDPMGADICIDETNTVCYEPTAIQYRFSDHPTDRNGQTVDNISIRTTGGVVIPHHSVSK
jgi:hypothetical protein